MNIYIYIFFFQEKISDLYKKLSKIVFVLIYGLYGLLAKEWVRKQKGKRYYKKKINRPFRVSPNLCSKAKLSGKPLIRKLLVILMQYILFLPERFCT